MDGQYDKCPSMAAVDALVGPCGSVALRACHVRENTMLSTRWKVPWLPLAQPERYVCVCVCESYIGKPIGTRAMGLWGLCSKAISFHSPIGPYRW